MKNLIKTSLFLSLVVVMASSCGQKTTSKKKSSTSNTITNPSTDPGSGSDGSDSIDGCNGVYRAGAISCYKTDINKIVFSGTSYPVSVWSSKNNLPSTYSQNNFVTDATFKVRIKPSTAGGGLRSVQGRACSGPMMNNFTRMKVYFMLRRQNDPMTTIYEATAKLDQYSAKLSLPVIPGTSSPYILEIMGVHTDHRCNTAYNSLDTNNKKACDNGTYYSDFPIQLTTTNYPDAMTSCVGLNIEYSTDSTYDLP